MGSTLGCFGMQHDAVETKQEMVSTFETWSQSYLCINSTLCPFWGDKSNGFSVFLYLNAFLRAKQISPTPRYRHRRSRDLFRGCESISFSVSAMAKAYDLKYGLGEQFHSFYRQTSQNIISLVLAGSVKNPSLPLNVEKVCVCMYICTCVSV